MYDNERFSISKFDIFILFLLLLLSSSSMRRPGCDERRKISG